MKLMVGASEWLRHCTEVSDEVGFKCCNAGGPPEKLNEHVKLDQRRFGPEVITAVLRG